MFPNAYRFALRVFWATCMLACLGSFLVLYCSVQYIRYDDSTTDTTSTIYYKSYEERGGRIKRNIKEIVEENRHLRETLQRLHHKLEKRELQVEDHSTRLMKSFQDEKLKGQEREDLCNKTTTTAAAAQQQDIYLNCNHIKNIKILGELGRGYTKVTHRGYYNGTGVAIKSAAFNSIDNQKCLHEKRANNIENCMMYSRYKIMKELLLYQQLKHPNVIKVLGHCYQSDKDTDDIRTRGLTVVTELGIPVTLMGLLQTLWHERFRIAVGLARILRFLSSSPLGSLVIKDFQLTQFVLVNDDIKISDLDDVGNDPKICENFHDCFIGNERKNVTLPCLNGQCFQYNEQVNMYNFHRFYLSTFLVPGAPDHVFRALENIKNDSELFHLDSHELVERLEKVLYKLRKGEGRNKSIQAKFSYKQYQNADFPGLHDYTCFQSFSSFNCHILVFDEDEAKEKCDNDVKCKAFVLSNQKTWTGYTSVFLKNESSFMTSNPQTMVFVKIT